MPRKEKNVRNVPPNTFTGKYEDWEDFSFRFSSYISLTGPRGAQALTMAQNAEGLATDAQLLTKKGEGKDVGLRFLSSHVFHQC